VLRTVLDRFAVKNKSKRLKDSDNNSFDRKLSRYQG